MYKNTKLQLKNMDIHVYGVCSIEENLIEKIIFFRLELRND